MTIAAVLVLLAGCGGQGTTEEEKESVTKPAQQEKNADQETSSGKSADNPQAPDDASLMKVGQTTEDIDGKLTLKAIVADPVHAETGPVTMTVSHAKVFLYRPSYDLIDYFHGLTHEDEKFHYVKFRIGLKNNSEKPVFFNPVAVVKTNTGEEVSWEEEFYLESMNGKLAPGKEKEGSMGFIIDETDIERLESVELETSSVLNEKKEEIAKANTISIALNK